MLLRPPSPVCLSLPAAMVAGVLSCPSLLPAQDRVEVTPWIGSYLVVRDFFNADVDLAIIGASGSTRVIVSQETTVMFGIRASVPIAATVAAEASLGLVRGHARFVARDLILDPATQEPLFDLSRRDNSNVFIGSLRAAIGLGRSNLDLILGGIIVNHGGDYWDNSTQNGTLTRFGAVLGLGFRANVSPRFPIVVRAEGNFYEFNPDDSDYANLGFFPGRTQADLVLSIGVPIGGARR